MVAAAVCERGRARCGFRFVSHSRYRPGWLAVWVVGCGRRKEGQVHVHFHLPSGLLRARLAKVCRPLSLSLHPIQHCSCALRSSFVCHDPRRNLSPPTDSTTTALPCPARRRCDLQPARELRLRPPLTTLNRGNTTYHNPRGTTRPLAASTKPSRTILPA
jgi:hypothetical protein